MKGTELNLAGFGNRGLYDAFGVNVSGGACVNALSARACRCDFMSVCRIAVFSIRVLRDERICIIAEQRPDCTEEEVCFLGIKPYCPFLAVPAPFLDFRKQHKVIKPYCPFLPCLPPPPLDFRRQNRVIKPYKPYCSPPLPHHILSGDSIELSSLIAPSSPVRPPPPPNTHPLQSRYQETAQSSE